MILVDIKGWVEQGKYHPNSLFRWRKVFGMVGDVDLSTELAWGGHSFKFCENIVPISFLGDLNQQTWFPHSLLEHCFHKFGQSTVLTSYFQRISLLLKLFFQPESAFWGRAYIY